MKIIDIFKQKHDDVMGNRQPCIAFLGDSVTHGCFEVYMKNKDLDIVYDMKNGYREKVREILTMLFPDVPCAYINAGISGDSAPSGLKRLERDVLSYKPDLVTICFGLNDCMQEEKGINDFRNAISEIIDKIKATGAEVIYMTPSLMTDKYEVSCGYPALDQTTKDVARVENAGWLEKYEQAARDICKEKNVPVCDCLAQWTLMREKGVDINNLLSNKINHPTRDMHWMFAYELVKTMFTHN